MDPSTKAAAPETAWSLEVVRGRQAGRAYTLGPGETVVGNALNGQPGVDLKDQEGDSPRRMAGRHARARVHRRRAGDSRSRKSGRNLREPAAPACGPGTPARARRSRPTGQRSACSQARRGAARGCSATCGHAVTGCPGPACRAAHFGWGVPRHGAAGAKRPCETVGGRPAGDSVLASRRSDLPELGRFLGAGSPELARACATS